MPRDNSSKSRSRSRRKPERKYSSDSSRSQKRKTVKVDKKDKEVAVKTSYDYNSLSDIKNHILYENIKIHRKSDQEDIMLEVKNILKKQFGGIEHVTKISGNEKCFTFAVGFKYDKDALKCVKEDGYIDRAVDRTRLVGKPTAAFEQCITMIKAAKKVQLQRLQKNEKKQKVQKAEKYQKSEKMEKNQKKPRHRDSRSPNHRHRYSSSSERDRKRKDDRRRSKSNDRRSGDQKSVWLFGLPSSIKGKEVQIYLDNHSSGPFPVLKWRWARLKSSNCEFMQVTLEEKKAIKLLNLREELQIQGCPCVITNAGSTQSFEVIKDLLKQFQLKISFPDKVNPGSLYKALNDSARVVQIVSFNKLVDGRSDSYIVTLGSAAKARDLRRLNKLDSGIKLEEEKGQLVYRPTKHSKLVMEQ